MNNRTDGHSDQNRYNGQGNYYQQNRRQQMSNERMTNNAAQRSGATPDRRRTFSKPQKRSFANRVFKDKSGKLNALGRIAVGALTISTLTGAAVAGKKIDKIMEFSEFLNGEEYNSIVEVIEANYDNSQYLHYNIPEAAYNEYTEDTLKAAIKNEPNMQTFLEEKKFDPAVWAYLLTGEVDRNTINNEEIMDALSDYLPYAEYDRNSEKEEILNNNISNFSMMLDYCTEDNVKNNVVNLLDSIIGQASLSNSKDALEYERKLNEEEIERIEYNTTEELEDKCFINSHFKDIVEKNWGQDAVPYLKTYMNFRNSRVQFINEKLDDPNTPKLLRNALEDYEGHKTWRGIGSDMKSYPIENMSDSKIANLSEYLNYCLLRNDFYEVIIEEQKEPESSIERINEANSQIDKRIRMLDVVDDFDLQQYMIEINQLMYDKKESEKLSEKAKREENRIDVRGHDLRFDDFDR